MTDYSTSDSIDSTDLETISHVGALRADKLREAGIETLAEFGSASPAEVTGILGNASLEMVNDMVEEASELADEIASSDQADVEEAVDDLPDPELHRVVLLAGENVWDDRNPPEVWKRIDAALAEYDIQPDIVGFPQDGNGSVQVKDWARMRSASDTKPTVDQQSFDLPERPGDDEEWTSEQWKEQFQERDFAMMAWADEVVVVEEGDYVESTINRAPDDSLPVHRYSTADEEALEGTDLSPEEALEAYENDQEGEQES